MTEVKSPVVQQAIIPTEESVKAKINLELTKNKFQNILQECENITFDKNDLQRDVPKLQLLRAAVKKIEDFRKVLKKPYNDAGKVIDKVAEDFSKPMEDVLTKKEAEYRTAINEVNMERERLERENQRILHIHQAIDDFVLAKTAEIARAETSNELTAIEKTIVSEWKNKAKYEEFITEFIERTKELTALLKKQRKTVEELEALQKKKTLAEKKGDDKKILQLMEKEESLADKVQESKTVVQETAINQMTAPKSYNTYVAPAAPKARRTTWKFEIDDLNQIVKEDIGLLSCELNFKEVSALLNTLKNDGTLAGKTELKYKGIRFYEHKDY